jgi:hypothetical protein
MASQLATLPSQDELSDTLERLVAAVDGVDRIATSVHEFAEREGTRVGADQLWGPTHFGRAVRFAVIRLVEDARLIDNGVRSLFDGFEKGGKQR